MIRRLWWMGVGATAAEVTRRWAVRRWRQLASGGEGRTDPAGRLEATVLGRRAGDAESVAVVLGRIGGRVAARSSRRLGAAWAGGRADARRKERELRRRWLAGTGDRAGTGWAAR